MSAVPRSQGTTDSERYLAKLADRSFLNLWSYPNVYNDKKSHNTGDGKELCDLLVICGEHVLIFSDKTIAWPNGSDVELSWRRWFGRAIITSVKQIRHAQRWIREFPDRIFLDPGCTHLLPLPFPSLEHRKVHSIAVALGAGTACRKYFNGGIGSLVINPRIKGDDHIKATGMLPFQIGDVDPNKGFIHVFDDATLDIVMAHMDTITDFTDYLTKREILIRSSNLIRAPGEEEMVAYYATHLNPSQEHDFTRPDGSPLREGDEFSLAAGQYSRLLKNPQYLAKFEADKDSYVWDRLIEAFTDNILAGTTIVPGGGEFILAHHEEGVRHMALVPRHLRRILGKAILEVLDLGRSADRMTRAVLPGETEANRQTGFFFMTLKVPSQALAEGYDQYRRTRLKMLEIYAMTFLHKHQNLKRIVGIATEPPGAGAGSSEDMILAEPPPIWSPEIVAELETDQKLFVIAREGIFREYSIRGNEFPDVPLRRQMPPKRKHLSRRQRKLQKTKYQNSKH